MRSCRFSRDAKTKANQLTVGQEKKFKKFLAIRSQMQFYFLRLMTKAQTKETKKVKNYVDLEHDQLERQWTSIFEK